MTKTTTEVGKKLPCGMVSLKMFHIPHSKALIIAYLDLRTGPKMKGFTFNVTDITRRTNIGKTVVRRVLKELENEGVLNRKGLSFYKLDKQKMRDLYYVVSESDTEVSESDTHVSDSDMEVSDSDSIHSSKLNSKKIDSSKLESKEQPVSNSVAETFVVSSPVPVDLESERSSKSLLQRFDEIFPTTTAGEAAPVTDTQKEDDSVGQTTAGEASSLHRPETVKRSAADWRKLIGEQHRNQRLYGSHLAGESEKAVTSFHGEIATVNVLTAGGWNQSTPRLKNKR